MKDHRILVTGGTGMIGSQLIELLVQQENEIVTVLHKRPLPFDVDYKKVETIHGDLTNYDDCVAATKGVDTVFHTAAFVGGNGLMSTRPASVMTPNIVMTSNLLKAAIQSRVERFLYTSSNCLYPDTSEVLTENEGLEGVPPRAHLTYSWVKRVGEIESRAYFDEYGLKVAIVRPGNGYGPRDNFDLDDSHVVSALVRKAVERVEPFVIWGSGRACRDFIHSRDIARGMIMALERYAIADPLNIATGTCTTILDLTRIVLESADFENAYLVFDKTRPEGQIRRILDTQKAKEKIGFEANIPLAEGIKETVEWYRASRSAP